VNYGNTCYANSIIQALYFCEPFRKEVLTFFAELQRRRERGRRSKSGIPLGDLVPPEYPYRNNLGGYRETVLTALADLFAEIHGLKGKSPNGPGVSVATATLTGRTTEAKVLNGLVLAPQTSTYTGLIEPRNFIARVRQTSDLFAGYMHHDSHEFLNFLLNQCSESLKEERRMAHAATDPAKASSISDETFMTFVERIFQGELVNETRCLGCETVTRREEHFLDLSLDIEQHSSISACLRNFSAHEMLRAGDKFYCNVCRTLQEAEKRMLIRRVPQVLALHLKRFKFLEANMKLLYKKLNYRISFPMELRVCNISDDAEDADGLYELFAVVVHVGAGPSHGHYVTLAKSSGGVWMLYDDDQVEIVEDYSLQEVFGISESGQSVTGACSSDCGYILFYIRRDEQPSVDTPPDGMNSAS
jgi:ubiquitin carboxyl-terminal hydrolase 12/46